MNKENLDCGAELDWEGIDIGKCIEGEIQDIKEYGVIVNLQGHKDVVGFVTHHQCKLLTIYFYKVLKVLFVGHCIYAFPFLCNFISV